MSRSYQVNYELEKKRRAELEKKQAGDAAEKLCLKYQSQLEDMKKKGYEAYIPKEIARLEADLDSIRQLLIDDQTIRARSLCRNVGAYVGAYEVLANTAIAQYERAERVRTERARVAQQNDGDALMDEYYKLVEKIDNPIAINIVSPRLEEIRRRIENEGEEAFTPESLGNEVHDIIESTNREVKIIEEKQNKEMQQALLNSQLDDVEILIKETKLTNAKAVENFAAKINSLKHSIRSNESKEDDFSEEIARIEEEVENAIISEEVRQTAVRAIFQQLRKQEFSVDAPQIFMDEEKDYVKIVARRPSGKQAVCEIDNHGAIKYKFDKYEGMTCLKDIERFNIDLDRIYSIKLSDERILWSNPDRLTRDTNQSSEDDRRFL